ncbi:MAG: hypothetical protein KGL39_42640 [Patescibacteria group bacterium]|nr:hypothetical protein [Patescibacteria group bacterium]
MSLTHDLLVAGAIIALAEEEDDAIPKACKGCENFEDGEACEACACVDCEDFANPKACETCELRESADE